MSVVKPNTYPNSAAQTITLASLASSTADPPAGREAAYWDNSSNLYEDFLLDGKITTGTSPTADRSITICAIPAAYDGSSYRYAGGGAGSDANLTPTQKGVIGSLIIPILVIPTNSTSNVEYRFAGYSLLAALRTLILPIRGSLFVFHDTAVNLHATGGNHELRLTGVNRQIV